MNPITNYFNAEKCESLFFIGSGFLAIIIGLYLLFSFKTQFYTGIAMPLIVLAFIQVGVGTTVYLRSPKDSVRVEKMIHAEKPKIQNEEIPRMRVVMKNFKLYRYVELAFMIIALLCMFVWKENQIIQGAGIGLFIQAALMLSLDFFAEKRGEEYLQFLLTLS